jgi:DNA ligase 4
MRLLLPGDDRRIYGLKEKKLADNLINVLAIDKKSNDALKLLHYRAPQNVKSDGDFASVAYFVFKNRCKDNLTMSIEQINHHLDNISINNAKGKEGNTEVNRSIHELIVNLSAIQLKWLIRIILKDLKIGIKEHTIFEAFHSDAYDLYNCTSSLEKVCELLGDPSKKLNEVSVSLFAPCRPMLSEKAEPIKIEELLSGKEFYIETKFDGERFQLHKNGKEFKYFSRNGNDYTDTFGANSLSGKLTQYISNSFKKEVDKVILDGEMCGYNSVDKILLSKGDTFDVKSMSAASLLDNHQICFCAFDILMFNNEILTNKSLKERIGYLEKVFDPVEGRLELSARQLASRNQQVADALNDAIDSRLEGIVVKDPDSVYAPNKRNAGWFKVKPDYMLGLNDDLDLLIIGGYYGSGRRKGLLSHFLLGVLDDNLSNDDNLVFQSFCKIGSGYTLKELSDFNQKLNKKWLQFDKKNPPKNILVSYEKPDVWIEPKDSLVVQIKAVEIIESDKYKCGLTLRFPRLEKFRDDKAPSDSLKLSELKSLREVFGINLFIKLTKPKILNSNFRKIKENLLQIIIILRIMMSHL